MIKKMAWLFSGFLAFSLIIFASSTPVHAVNTGYFAPKMFSFYERCNASTYDPHSAIFNAQGLASFETSSSVCSLDTLSFGGDGVSSISPLQQDSYFNIQFTLYISHPAGSSDVLFPNFKPAFNGAGGMAGSSFRYTTTVMETNIEESFTTNSVLQYNVQIRGMISGTTSGLDTIGFSGTWLENTSGQRFRIVMSKPIINIYRNYDQLIEENSSVTRADVHSILGLLRGGITANIDTSGMVNEQKNTTNAINQQSQQQHQDAQKQLEESQKQTAEQQKQTQTLEETKDFLTSTDPPDFDASNLGGVSGFLPPGPIDSILVLPIRLLNGIVDAFTGSHACAPISLPLPFVSQTLELPCVRPLLDKIGISALWNVVGGIISAFIILDTLKWLYKFVDDTLTFRENNSTIWGGL